MIDNKNLADRGHDNNMARAKKIIKEYPKTHQSVIIKLLRDFAAFNILTKQMVYVIGDAFEVDAIQMCKDNGITYWIRK